MDLFVVMICNSREYNLLMSLLEEKGYTIFGDKPTSREYDRRFQYIHFDENDKRVVRSQYNISGKQPMTIDFAINIIRYGNKKKILNLKDDPFGEENWWETNEQFENRFEKGDIVYYYGINPLLHGEKVEIVLSGFQINGDSYIVKFLDKRNESDRYVYISNLSKNKRKSRILNQEDDPFGEENWGYIQESDSFDLKREIKNTIIRIDTENEYYQFVSYLDELGYKWKEYDGNVLDKYEFRNNNFCIRIDSTNLVRCGSFEFYDWQRIENNKFVDYEVINFKDLNLKKKERKSNPEVDPFGEEDWGYVQESFVIRNDVDIIIRVQTQEEYDILMKYFDILGYNWGNPRKLASYPNYFPEYRSQFCVRISSGDKSMSFGSFGFYQNRPEYNNYVRINFKDLGISKYKKKLNLEEDPFGEENWGYLEENKKIKRKMKLNEEIKGDEIRISMEQRNHTFEMTGAPPKDRWPTKWHFEKEVQKFGWKYAPLTGKSGMLVANKADSGTSKYNRSTHLKVPILTYHEAYEFMSTGFISKTATPSIEEEETKWWLEDEGMNLKKYKDFINE